MELIVVALGLVIFASIFVMVILLIPDRLDNSDLDIPLSSLIYLRMLLIMIYTTLILIINSALQ